MADIESAAVLARSGTKIDAIQFNGNPADYFAQKGYALDVQTVWRWDAELGSGTICVLEAMFVDFGDIFGGFDPSDWTGSLSLVFDAERMSKTIFGITSDGGSTVWAGSWTFTTNSGVTAAWDGSAHILTFSESAAIVKNDSNWHDK